MIHILENFKVKTNTRHEKINYNCGGTKTWALVLGLSLTFYQQYVRGEEIVGEPHN